MFFLTPRRYIDSESFIGQEVRLLEETALALPTEMKQLRAKHQEAITRLYEFAKENSNYREIQSKQELYGAMNIDIAQNTPSKNVMSEYRGI